MKTLLKVLNVIFTFLGVVFFILLLVAAYLWFADPFHLKPLLFPTSPASNAISVPRSSSGSVNFTLTAAQIAGLKQLGIDTSKLPSSISTTMEACFTAKLGSARTAEIKQGSLISAVDLYLVQSCLK